MSGTSFLRVPTLRATGTRTGAVLNDSPVGCQSRDLVRPQAATPLVSTFTEKYRCQCGTFFCCRFSWGVERERY